MEDYQQMTLWDLIYEEKHIDKPIRLIELFSGVGSQYKALKRLTDKVESYKTCEWAIPSIAAYNAIHIKDHTDYSASKTKEELIAYLDGNISSNYDNPCNVSKLKESKLREIYNNCIATHNLMNIMKVKGKDLQIVETDKYEYIMTYSFPCVLAGTKVKTDNGYQNIENIVVGDKVLTHTGKYQNVLKTMKRNSNHYYIIKGVGCNLYLTEEHPLYVLRDNKIQWVKVKDLKLTDKLSYNINTENKPCQYSNELLWLLGRYVADGYSGNCNSICLAIGNKKAKVFEENTSNFKWKTFKKNGCIEYRIADKNLKKVCLEFSVGAKNKKIPQWIIDLPREQLNAFFNGYMSGDGHIRERSNTTQLMCSTVSKELYLGLQDIMIKLFNSCPSLYIRHDKRKETFNDTYNLQLSLHYKNICQERIGNHLFVRLSSIKKIDTTIPVYNLEVENDNSYTCDNVIVHNCQDLSLAGKGKGMSVSQADGGTRSGLLWEVERILTELSRERDSMPQILLMENVPEVIGSKNIRDFQKWESFLTKLGYKNYIKILNSKDYGIPQNRRRCFMVSLLGDYTYHFPSKIKLELKLKDMLESNVDEKYYLSNKMIEYISATGTKNFSINNSEINCKVARPLTTCQNKRAGTTNYVAEDLPENIDLRGCKQIADLNYYNHEQSNRVYDVEELAPTIRTGHDDAKAIKILDCNNQRLNETLLKNNIEDGDFIDAYNRDVKKDVVGTITTRVSESNMKFIAESVNYLGTTNGHQSGNVYADDGLALNLTACDYKSPIKIATDEYCGTYQFSKSDNFMLGKDRAKLGKDIADTILTSPKEAVMIKNATKQGYLLATDGDGIDISTRMQHHRGNVQKNTCQTLTTMGGENVGVLSGLRIRKLTPCECMRLMGFEDADYQAMVDAGLSNSAIYHCAGDSIVVDTLYYVFKQLV